MVSIIWYSDLSGGTYPIQSGYGFLIVSYGIQWCLSNDISWYLHASGETSGRQTGQDHGCQFPKSKSSGKSQKTKKWFSRFSYVLQCFIDFGHEKACVFVIVTHKTMVKHSKSAKHLFFFCRNRWLWMLGQIPAGCHICWIRNQSKKKKRSVLRIYCVLQWFCVLQSQKHKLFDVQSQ